MGNISSVVRLFPHLEFFEADPGFVKIILFLLSLPGKWRRETLVEKLEKEKDCLIFREIESSSLPFLFFLRWEIQEMEKTR